MDRLYVFDTNVLISYYRDIFKSNSSITTESLQIVDYCLKYSDGPRVSIPSITFIELYNKFCNNDENTRKIRFEVLMPMFEKENFEIREIDREILTTFINIDDNIVNLENHDKIVLSTAITLNGTLITSDTKIQKYVAITDAVKIIF